jgi:CRISPR/Cas system-associated endonuclease Cas1
MICDVETPEIANALLKGAFHSACLSTILDTYLAFFETGVEYE